MPRRIVILAVVLAALSGCSSGLNPFNWFRGSEQVAIVPEGGFPADNDYRELVAQVTDLTVLRASGGAVIRAEGLPPRLGYWDAELVPENDEKPVDGTLTYKFRIAEPWEATRQGTPYSRKVFVAHFISDRKLEGVSRIEVVGASNARVARR